MSAGKLGWRTAARIAWRDLRAARGKFLFIAFAISGRGFIGGRARIRALVPHHAAGRSTHADGGGPDGASV